jgi:hypothetical protein
MMSKRDILEISCKILGLFCLVQAMPYVLSSVAYVRNLSSAFLVIPFIAYLVSAFILIKWAGKIAAFLVRENQQVEIKADKNWQKPIYTLALRIVGAVVCIKAIPAIIRTVPQIIFRSEFRLTPIAAWISLLASVVYLALGIYFIGGAKAVVRIALRGSLREPDSEDG